MLLPLFSSLPIIVFHCFIPPVAGKPKILNFAPSGSPHFVVQKWGERHKYNEYWELRESEPGENLAGGVRVGLD
jgi:hypothetical protein